MLEMGGASFQDDSSLMSSAMGASKPVDAREMQSYAKVRYRVHTVYTDEYAGYTLLLYHHRPSSFSCLRSN